MPTLAPTRSDAALDFLFSTWAAGGRGRRAPGGLGRGQAHALGCGQTASTASGGRRQQPRLIANLASPPPPSTSPSPPRSGTGRPRCRPAVLLAGQRLGPRRAGPGRGRQAHPRSCGRAAGHGEARLDRLTVHSSLLELAAHGGRRPRQPGLAAPLDATVPRLAAVAAALGVDPAATPLPSGAFRPGAHVGVATHAERIDVALDGPASDLAGPLLGAQELIGASPTLQAKAAIEAGRAAAVDSLVLQGQGIRLEGEPRFGFADQALGAPRLKDSGPEAAGRCCRPAGSRAGWPCARTLGGPCRRRLFGLDGTVEALAIAGQTIARLGLTATPRAGRRARRQAPADGAARQVGAGAEAAPTQWPRGSSV